MYSALFYLLQFKMEGMQTVVINGVMLSATSQVLWTSLSIEGKGIIRNWMKILSLIIILFFKIQYDGKGKEYILR